MKKTIKLFIAIIIIALIVLVLYFCFNNKFDSKLFTLNGCENSSEIYKNINVKVTKEALNNDVCQTKEVIVNDETVTIPLNINSYEIYNNGVVFLAGDVGGNTIYIYNTKTNKIEKEFSETTLDNYRVLSYKIENGVMTIETKNCGEQCGIDMYNLDCSAIKSQKSSLYPSVTYVSSYKNGTFTNPEVSSKTSFENEELFNKYYSDCK